MDDLETIVGGGESHGKTARMRRLVEELRAKGYTVHEVKPGDHEHLKGSDSTSPVMQLLMLDELEVLRLLRSPDPATREVADALWNYRAAPNDEETKAAAAKLKIILQRGDSL